MYDYGNAAVAQSVERRIGSAEVTGPIPVSSLKQRLFKQNMKLGNYKIERMNLYFGRKAFCFSPDFIIGKMGFGYYLVTIRRRAHK